MLLLQQYIKVNEMCQTIYKRPQLDQDIAYHKPPSVINWEINNSIEQITDYAICTLC